MKPSTFVYHRARDVDGAVALAAELGEDAKFLAGGQSLVPMMNFRLARPKHLIDIDGLAELRFLRRDGDVLRLGALTTHHAMETAPDEAVRCGFEVIKETVRWIGHLPIRTRGTVGGSLAHGDATAEWCLLAVLLDAEIIAVSPRGHRVIPARDAFLGFFTTLLEPDELITEVVFRRPGPHAAFGEFAQRQGDFAVVAAGVALDLVGGRVTGGRVVLGGVAPAPVRVAAAEAVLAQGERPSPALFTACAHAAAEAVDPPGDASGSPAYRRALVRTLVARAGQEASRR